MSAPASRRAAPDALRGLCLMSMAAYHACWDAVYLFHRPWGWFGSFWAGLWQQSICWSFILLSGWCHRLSRRPVRRGLMLLFYGAVIAAVSAAVSPETAVRFGILTFLGTAGLVTAAARPLLERVPARAGLGVSFALFLAAKDAAGGYLGFAGEAAAGLPRWLYANGFTAFLGFPPAGFASSDYFPLLPWLALYWCGFFLHRLTPEEGPALPAAPGIAALGRRSLWVYLLHQPVIYGAMALFLSR